MFTTAPTDIKFRRPAASGRRPFTVEEDARLLDIMTKVQFVNWEQVAAHMGDRTSRQCRERWVNYLNPAIRTDPWNDSEDNLLLEKVNELGRCWSNIGKFFNGRSENDVKNRWYSHLRYRTIESDDGKFKFINDPSESLYPDRKKRHRVKISPQQNALRMLEQQRTRQTHQHHQQQIHQQQIQQIQQQQIQQQIQQQQQSLAAINLPILLQNQQQIQQQFPQIIEPKPMPLFQTINQQKAIPTPQFIQLQPQIQMQQEQEQKSQELGPENIPEPEYVDFWDQNLFDEATTDYSFMSSTFTGFSLY